MSAEIIQFVPGLKAERVEGIVQLQFEDGSTFAHPIIGARIVHRLDDPDTAPAITWHRQRIARETSRI